MTKLLLQFLLFILFSFIGTKLYAQGGAFNCDPSVPSNPISLINNPFDAYNYTYPVANSGAGFQCCGQSASFICEQFTVNTHANAIGLRVTVSGSNGAVNIKINDCSTPLTSGQVFCITGGTSYSISICTDATSSFNVLFESIGPPTINSPTSTTANCVGNIIFQGFSPTSVDINSTAPNNPGDYNSLLDCSTNCGEISIFSPIAGSPNSITYQVCGDVLAPSCYNNIASYCGNITIAVNPPIVVSGSNPVEYCNGNTFTLNPTVSGGLPGYSYLWTGPAYQPGQEPITQSITNSIAGTYQVDVLDATGCGSSFSIQAVSVSNPTVNAGTDQTFCTPQNSINLLGSSTQGTTVVWSGGTGTYSPNNTILNPTYNVDVSEQVVGSLILTMTANNACGSISDNVQINFSTANGIQLSGIISDITCFGASTGGVNISVSGGSGNYTYQWSNGSTNEDLSSVAAGNYSVTVTDINYGCTASQSFTITQPAPSPPFSVSLSTSQITCFNANDGSITSTLINGVSPFTYSWSGGNGSNPNLTNIGPGTYYLDVTDANGCIASANSTITNPNDIVTTYIQSNVVCNGQNNGSIDATTTGGTGTLTFLWVPGNFPTEDINNLNPGNYTLTVTDGNGCTDNTNVTITEPQVLGATNQVTNLTCFGAQNGSIDLTPTGGTGPYTFLWNPGGITTEDRTNLSGGIYTVTVTDGNGCTFFTGITVGQPAEIVVSSSLTAVSCFGGNNGSIDITVSGGVAPLSYSWTGPNSFSSQTEDISGLVAGTYSITITDATNCTVINSPIITEPNLLSLSFSPTSTTCNGSTNGSVDLTVSGGTSPFTYSWSNLSINEDLTNIGAGTYSVSVTDDKGCTANGQTTVTQPNAISSSSNNTNVLCNGASTGVIDLTVTGGTTPYTYTWSNNAITEDLNGIPTGIYTITITDANSCIGTYTTSISESQEIDIFGSTTNLTCNGSQDGAINITVSGGSGTFTAFSWSNGAATEDLVSMPAGTYTVNVTDSYNCTNTNSFTITQPSAITATSNNANILCNGATTGAVDLTATGGEGTYTYLWSNNAITEDLSGVAAGTYSVVVTDGNGCTGNFSTSLTQGTAITATSNNTNILCNGAATGAIDLTATGGDGTYTYLWSNNAITEDLSGVAAGTYSVVVTDGNGCTGNFSTSLTQGTAITATSNNTNILCNGAATGAIDLTATGGDGTYTYLWSNNAITEDLSGVAAGTYSVVVTDGNGCTGNFSTSLTQGTAITATSNNTNILCNGATTGAIDLTATGGDGTYTYLWSNNAITEDLSGVAAGTYSVVVTDGNGCTGNFSTSLTQGTAVTATSINTNILCNGAATGAIDLTATGGDGTYTYLWSNNAITEDLSGVAAGTYSVVVTDGNGCTGNFSTSLTQGTAITATSNNTNILCNGAATGAIDLTATGGDGTYTYLWSNNAITEDLSGVAAGTYSVVVTDGNGCTGNFSTSLTQGTAITATSNNTNILCNGAATGAIDLTATGGDGTYTYLWSNNAITEDLSGVAAGTYSVVVTDGNGCTGNFSTSLTQGTAITATSNNTNILCNGAATGAIDLTATGGDGTYTYLWSNNAITEDLSGVAAGTYSVVVTDGNGCTGTFSTSLTQGTAITATSNNTNIDCNGAFSGAIDITPTGGSGPFTFLWSNNAITEDLSGVAAGTYSVVVTDGNGCTGNFSTSLTQGTAITATSNNTNILCNGAATGAIDLTATGGNGTYTYLWSNNAIAEDLSGVAAGTYSVVVTDGNGCTGNFSTSLTQGTAITATSNNTNILCNGAATGAIDLTATGGDGTYTYLWSNNAITEDLSGVAAGTYSVVVTDGNGCTGNFSTSLTQGTAITATSNNTNILCNGAATGAIDLTATGGDGTYTYLWSNNAITEDLSGVAAGTYSVVVTDGNGCTGNFSTSLTQGTAITATSNNTNILCNGAATGAIDLTATGGDGTYTYLWSNNAITEDLSGVAAGTYSVVVTDGNGCTGNFSTSLTQGTAITATSNNTNILCNGAATGAIDLTATGGDGTYTYLWSNNAITEDLSGVAAGTYSVVVTDGNGCTGNFSTSLTQGTAITATSNNTNILCNGAATGAIDLTATGGDGTYTYLWSNNAITEDLSGVAAGTYSVVVTDGNGCTGTFSTSLTQGTAITATSNNTNIDCNGAFSGAIDITPTGGSGPFTFLWSNNAITEDLTALAAGNYSLIITDALGCTGNFTTTLTQPTPLVLSATVTNIDCNGNSTGSVDLNVSGGTGPYTFSWSNNAVSEDLNGISSGIYNVTVTDFNGCSGQLSATVTQPASGLTISNVNTNIDCNGATTGAIDITVNGGTGPFTYLWNNGSTVEDLTAVASGNYSLTVTDNNGCQIGLNTSLSQPNAIVINASIVDVLCNGFSTGVIDVTVSGGISPYAFSWSNSASTEDLNGVVAGTYFLTVTDVNDCAQPATLTINEPGQLTLSKTSINVSCNGLSDGSVDITVSGGINPYTFSWNDGSVTEDLTNIPAGTYTLTVTDGNGCVASTTSVVTEPSAISATTSSTPASCNPDGTASVTVSGGVPGYTYLWSNGATTNSINGVAAGNYTVNITDANNCTVSASATIAQTSGLTATATINTPIACNGGTAIVDVTASGGTAPLGGIGSYTVAAGNQSFTVTDANGCSVVATLTVTEPTALSASVVSSGPIQCNGGVTDVIVSGTGGTPSYTGIGLVSGLTAGNYSYSITDANGCSANTSISITEPDAITLAAIPTNVTCNAGTDGAVDLTVTGGTPGFTFTWSDGSSNEDLTNVVAGNYSVIVSDANGCSNNTNVSVNEPSAISATTSSTPASCNPDGTASVTVSGGVPGYTYLWSNGATTNSITGVAAGNYTINITDANNCTVSASATIAQTSGLTATATLNTAIACNGGTAIVDVTASGGTAPLGGVGSYTVAAGNQSFTVTDANGCSVVATLTVTEPTALSASVVSSGPIQCNGGVTDVIVSGTGGTPSYAGIGLVSGLTAGNYSYTITDANGCSANTSISITEPDAITLAAIPTNVTCNAGTDGAVDLTVTGGTPGFTFTWSDGSSNEDLTNVVAGNYSVIVSDANGCSNNTNVSVNEPSAISATTSSTPASCNPDGTASVTVSGGVPGYTYLWSNGATTNSITGVAAGNYTVNITDANNCTVSASVTIAQTSGLTATATINTPIACNGGTAVVAVTASGGTAPLSGIGSFTVPAGNQSFTVTDANGCSVVATLTVTEPTALSASVVSSGPILCNGGVTDVIVSGTGGTPSYAGIGLVSGLTAGNYSYTITDANGCSANTSISITEPDAITLAAIPTNVTCNAGTDGAVDLTVTGGTPGFTFTWSDGSSNEDLTNVVAGNYSVIVSDANGCSNNTNVSVNEPSAISATTSSTPASCNPDGTASVTVSGGVPGYTYLWSNGATANSITGVAAGNYTVNITDANNCTVSASATIAQTSGLTATASLNTPIACNGGTAVVAVTASGGTAPLSGIGSFTVPAGNQSFTVTDANGCSVVATLTVTEPTALSASVGTSNVTCNGANDGILSANVTGGTPNYSYSWSNGQSTNTITNLGPGSINLTVTDANGCVATATGTIVEPTALSATNTAINISCNGAQDGSIDLTVSGGTPGYTYSWNDPSNTTNEDVTNLNAGTYSVIITDNNNCTLTYTVTLTEPSALIANATVTTPITVNGGTGVITVSATGGTPNYNGTGTFTVTSGTYTYTVTDANGCSTTISVTITEPNALQATATISSAILCNGGTGIIDVNGVGGLAPYTGIGSNTVQAGTYTYTIVDAGNSTANVTITITEPSVLASSISSTNATCNGLNDGSAIVTASGGTAPYTYLWSNNATTAGVSNLNPGLYTVTITDINGCTSQSSVTITQPAALVASSAITNPVLCFGGTATITVSAVGGVAAYTGTGTFTVNAGTYNYTVTDANGCTSATSVIVTEPTLLTSSISSSNVSCNGANNGSATVTGNGGTLPYSYLWTTNATTGTVSNVSPGNYSVTVTDANGCTSQSSITISQPSTLVAQAVLTSPILCFGGTATVTISGSGGTAPYSGVGVNTVNAGTYNYTISDVNGCTASTNISVNQPAILSATTSSTNATCNGANNGSGSVNASGGTAPYTYSWSNNATTSSINNLSPGAYTVTVTDANGCSISTNITISQPTLLQANSSVTTPILCNGGNAVVSVVASGGTAPYTGIGNFTVAAGLHTYNITDANGCATSTSITVTQPPILTSSASSTNLSCNGSNNGTAIVTANGGTAPYTYLWSNNQSSSTITNLAPGNYSVTVTDANGCTAQSSVSITQPAILTAASSITSAILCNGGSATVTVTGAGGTLPYTGTGSFSVVAGIYNYTVTDANGCIAQSSITVTEPTAVSANATVTQPIACFGGTGQISITATGGTAPYNGTGIQTVLSGTYNYTVSDINGCTASTSIAITEPTALSVTVNGTNPLCNGTGNGTALANANGGTAPYSYAWSNGQTTAQATNLSAGTYTVTVTDANGCTTTGSVTLTQPVNLTASSNITSPILCFGGTGVVTVSASGGTSPYVGTGAFNAVAGVSNYTVTDANGCSATTSITVNQPTALVASSAVASSIPCFGGTGNIIVTATGGTPNYTGTGTFAANAGPHTYTVTDANGCSTTTTLTISQPSALNPIANITNPIACNGGFATINVSANGGTPAYSGVGNFAALAGVQNYTVIDANGCSASVSINVTQPTVLTSSITSQNVTCNGLNNGSATATGQGGTPNYTYSWSNGATTATVTNLSPGAYSVTVTDANGCQSISNVVITQPTTLSSSVVQTAIVPCFGSTGTVFVSATGGSAPYVGTGNFSVVAGNQSFTVTDVNGCTSVSSLLITQPTQLVATASQTTPILCFGGQASVAVTGTGGTGSYTGTGSFNVNAGNNTFTIQDANGCSASTTISIAQPTAVTASFNNTSVSCFGFSNGASTATVSGGTPGYSYLWSTGSVTNTINNQFAGNYGLQVTDANGCIFNFTTSINQPAQMVATANIILPIACFGGQAIVLVNGAGGTPGYSGNGTFFEFAGTYTYTLVDQNGCIDSTTITVTQPPAFTAVATITSPIACNGGQATVVVSANGGTAPYTGTGTFTVSAGNYTYTIIDANGCTATTTITVTQPAVLTATATIINPILCNGGQATVQVSANGGTTPYAGTGIFNVVSGNYNYIVSDVNGCNTNVSINVPQPTLLQSSVSQNNVTCNGANDGSAIVFFNGGTPQINVLWSTGATTNSISNLAPGNYSVTVTDANGCTNINALTITQPNTLVATATQIVPIQCFNGNATVVVSATGGTSPFSGVGTFFPTAGNYIYPVTDANGCSDTALITINQPTQLTAAATIISPVACFGGLATVNITAAGGISPYQGTGTIQVSAGNQSFTVTDANGCALTITLFIAQPPILNTQVSVQNVSCFNAGNGSATVVTSGGTPGYQYLWSNGDTTAITNNLIPGVYTITVTDTNGCQTTNQATITQPTLLTLSASITTPVFCFGGNATVSVSASGGTAPYTGTGNFNQTAGTTTYYVTDANGCLDSIIVTVTQPNPLIASVVQTSPVACNGGTANVTVSAIGGTPAYVGTGPFVVIAGWQNFTVTDNYGCTDTTSIFITQPPLLVATATLVSPVLCNGGTAVVNITAAGGTPSYSGLGSFTVVAGTYTYTVSDANGCTANVSITVTQPNPLQAVATISSPIICNGGTGVITVTGTGGTAPYVGTGSFTVAAGTYTYTITDANNCSSTVTIVINQPPVLSLSLTPININCNGFATGSITANPAGGQGPYTYVWSNGQTSQSITNLLAGLYTVTVTDNLGCTVSGNTTLTQPANPLALQESHVNILCFGNNTGSIDLSVTGGTSPYSYVWSNGSSNQDIQGLIAGSYNVTVTDANGCIAVLSVNVTQPAAPLSVSYVVSNVSCFGLSDGAIDVTPVGGTGPFTYFWTSGQSSEDLNNIPQGIYIVAITDANNCVSSAQISVTQPTAPLTANISQNPISCYGYNDGQLTANAQGGTLPYSYLWTPGGQTGSIVSSLGAGNYSVTITDANGCSTSANDVLNSPPPLIASFTASDNVVCLPSNVTFTNASIGTFTSTTWNLSNGTSFNGNQFTTTFNTLGCFDVTLLITDANGCTADTTVSNAVCVVPGPSAAFVTGTPEIDFVTGEMEFINNSQNYTGSMWTFGDGGNSTLDNPIHFYPSSTIDAYNVMLVVYDANGCSDTAIAVVESSDVIRLTVPNAFTPNGDGLNDLFIPVISNPEQAKYYQFDVFNRWGQIVFSSNKPGEGWDGKYKGKLCPFGTYNWKVSFDVTGQESTNANGHVTLVK